MSKFTAGKWKVDEIYGDHYVVFAEGLHTVADCFGDEANARLIAAAPELYRMLREELIPTSDYGGLLSFSREAKVRELLDRIDRTEASND